MFTKKILIVCLIFLITLGIFSACGSKTENETQKITTIYGDWPPDLIAYLAQEKGFYEKNDVNVELIRGEGYEEQLAKRKELGNQLIWTYTILDFIQEYSENPTTETQVVLIEDHSDGADAVLAMTESNINSIADLKGKKVGVEKGQVSDFFLHILLDEANINTSEIETIDISSENIPQAFIDGKIDAGVAYEPAITEAVNNGAKIVIDSKTVNNAIVDVYVSNSQYIEKNEKAFKKFIAAILDTVEYFENNQKECLEIMAKPFNSDVQELEDTFKGISLTNRNNNSLMFSKSAGPDSLENLIRKATRYLNDQDQKINEFEIEDLTNSNLVNSIMNL